MMIAYSRSVTGTDCVIGAAVAGVASSIAVHYAGPAAADSEEEVRPGPPPVVAAGDDRARAGHFDVLAVPVLLESVGRRELHLDLAWLAGVVWLDGREILQRLLRTCLDQLARAHRRQVPRAEAPEPDLHLDGGQAVAEQLATLTADRAVPGDQHDRAAPVAAERSVDPGLADERAVEAEVLPGLARDRMRHDAVRRPRHRMHPDEQCGVAALLEELRVLRPFALNHELAVGIEVGGQQRVERVVAARAVAVHDDDLGCSGGLRAAHSCVDLLRVELARLVVERLVAARLRPLDEPGDAFDVADDVDAHRAETTLPAWRPGSRARASSSPAARAASGRRACARSRPRVRASWCTTTRVASTPSRSPQS